jgi:hypothetical protein
VVICLFDSHINLATFFAPARLNGVFCENELKKKSLNCSFLQKIAPKAQKSGAR